MSTTLSQRLRMMYIEVKSKNPSGIEGFDTPLFFEAIAQAEAMEGQAIGEQPTDEQLYAEAMASVTPESLDRMDKRCAAIEAGEQTEGEPVIQTQDMLTRGEAQQLIRNMRARCQAGQCDYALAHPPKPSGLSDEVIERIRSEWVINHMSLALDYPGAPTGPQMVAFAAWLRDNGYLSKEA